MAPKKQPKNKLGKTAKYYRSHPEARAKKKIKDTEVNKRPEQRKKRSELVTKRRQMKKKGVKLKWKDLAHTKNWIKLKSIKANRWSKSDSKWDRKARWKKA